MVTIDKDNYKSFRQNLEYLITDTDIKSREQLSFLMAQRSFRRKKDGTRLYPSEKQLNIAWDYVSSKAISSQTLTEILYRTEKYKYYTVKRVTTKEITYNNKKYRKGQFLPKGYK